jgi:hypothetical protein
VSCVALPMKSSAAYKMIGSPSTGLLPVEAATLRPHRLGMLTGQFRLSLRLTGMLSGHLRQFAQGFILHALVAAQPVQGNIDFVAAQLQPGKDGGLENLD